MAHMRKGPGQIDQDDFPGIDLRQGHRQVGGNGGGSHPPFGAGHCQDLALARAWRCSFSALIRRSKVAKNSARFKGKGMKPPARNFMIRMRKSGSRL